MRNGVLPCIIVSRYHSMPSDYNSSGEWQKDKNISLLAICVMIQVRRRNKYHILEFEKCKKNEGREKKEQRHLIIKLL